MNKFLRHIRQNVLMENKTGKPAAMPSAGKPAGRYFNCPLGRNLSCGHGNFNFWYHIVRLELREKPTKPL